MGFGGADVAEWPRLRTFPRAEELERPVDVLSGVGPAVKKRLERLGLKTLGDLVAHRPFRYEEPVPEVRMADLQADRDVAIAGEVLSTSTRRRGRLQMLTARISDGTATVSATWFNQPWLERQLQPGTAVRLRGRQGRYGFDVRSFDIGEGEATADFAPVYPASEDITAKKLRELVGAALPLRCRTRSPPTSSNVRRCPSEWMRSGRCIVPARSPRRKQGGAGLPSTSCCCSRSGSRGGVASVSRRSHRRSARPASWSRATATSCRSG